MMWLVSLSFGQNGSSIPLLIPQSLYSFRKRKRKKERKKKDVVLNYPGA